MKELFILVPSLSVLILCWSTYFVSPGTLVLVNSQVFDSAQKENKNNINDEVKILIEIFIFKLLN